MTDPVIFLDFDGVLLSAESERTWRSSLRHNRFDHLAVGRLNQLVVETGAVVVVSSSMRVGSSLPKLEALLQRNGFVGRVVGVTPKLDGYQAPGGWSAWVPRSEEIKRWRQTAGHVGPFVILDDEGVDPSEHLVQTESELGLLDVHVQWAAAVLARPGKGG